MKKQIIGGITLLLIIALTAGCGSGRDGGVPGGFPEGQKTSAAASSMAGDIYEYEMAIDYDYAAAEDAEAAPADRAAGIAGPSPNYSTGGSGQPVSYERKVIQTYDLQLETKEFDAGVELIQSLTEEYGGYVEFSHVDGKSMYNEFGRRYASFTLRIPTDKLESFVQNAGTKFNLVSKQQSSSDITDQYYDTDARLRVLEVQEERLVAMLEQAEELQYLLEVERELSNVRYEIESLHSYLKRMDSQISLSTVNIGLTEVVEYQEVKSQPASFGQRLENALGDSGKAFVSFWENVLIGLIMVAPNLLILLAVIVVLFLIFRWRKITKKRKTAAENIPPANRVPHETNEQSPPQK